MQAIQPELIHDELHQGELEEQPAAPDLYTEDSGSIEAAACTSPPDTPAGSELALWIGRDRESGHVVCGFDSGFEMPAYLRNPGATTIVWNQWFGNVRQAARVVELLLKVRSPHTASFSKNAQRSTPAAVLSLLFGNPRLGCSLLEQLPPREREQADPLRRLPAQLHSLHEGKAEALDSWLEQASAIELARRIEELWPCMGWLHDNGAYLPQHAAALLRLAMLRDGLQGGALGSTDRIRALLCATLLLFSLPPRLAALLAIQTRVFRECSSTPFRFFGLTVENCDPQRPLWDQLPAQVAHETLAYLLCAAGQQHAAVSPLERVRQLEARLVMQDSLPRTFARLYQQFCDEEAGPRYARLRETFERYSVALEVRLEGSALPKTLIGRPLAFDSIRDSVRLQQRLRQLIESEAGSIEALDHLLADSQSRLDRVQSMHAQIMELGQTPSVSNLLKIAERAEAARQEILSNRDWFSQSLEAARPYVQLWLSFYQDVSALQEDGSPKAKARTEPRSAPISTPVIQTQSSTPQPESELVRQLREDLTDAEHDSEQLRSELREARAELHRLQQLTHAIGLKPKVDTPAVDTRLLRRVASDRASLKPAEVMAWFTHLAGDRLEVLDSAWQSLQEYPGHFVATERMFELLDKLLFGYLDAIKDGTPDTQARELFGNKSYSAKESDTTMSDARLRAMREFEYQGEKRLFERHLKVSNLTGAEGMRIYFDIVAGKVVLAYAGPHLDVSSSN